jgi:phage terminase large subunit-like protein
MVNGLSKAEKLELNALIEEKDRRKRENRLQDYRPYAKQAEFHAAGAELRERLFRAGNQLGKTWAGGFEAAMHLTGIYPDGWKGRRFDRPVNAWASGVTGETTRDNPQRIVLGQPGDAQAVGTGTIPKRCIIGDPTPSRGVANAVDSVRVRHISGGVSTLGFKSYEKGREKWQGPTLDFVWFDEEPPPDIYSEGLTRTNATGGIVWTTFTPLLGMSEVVRRFLTEQSPDRCDINMTIEDAEHYTPEERARIIASYPAHEREARAKGVPILGSGRIFPVSEDLITIDAFEIPAHWVQLGALDFGWDHPTAAIRMAWDRDADCIYYTHAHRLKEATPVIHAAALKPWGARLPWVWPHDGLQHDKGSGEQLASQYRTQGLNMLPERVTFEDGTNGVEAGLMDMLDRMQTGRLKVFSHLVDWFEEFRLYHRKDGKVVKEFDDLMSASRYALMGKRFAEPTKTPQVQPAPRSFGWQGM